MTNHNASRRKFLRTASVVSGSVGAAAAPFALNLATLGSAVAQTAGPYKAIVCLFMYGGNDASNMIVRTDATSFNVYTQMRNQAPESIALLAARHRRRTQRRAGDAGAPRRRRAARAEVHGRRAGSTENSAFTSACIRA